MGDTEKHRRFAPQSTTLTPSSSQCPSYRNPESQRGGYLLEYAVVLFGVAVFIVGFSDVARIFHARGAVRAGVTEGLRCLYPTDAGCSDETLANGWFPADRFNARITGDQTNRYELPRISYGLSSSWFNEPVSEASFATKQLTSVTLTQPQDAYRQYQVLFPVTAHAVYLLKTQELPRVAAGTAGSAAERVLSPRFIDPETGSERPANRSLQGPMLTLDASRVRASTLVNEQRVSFTINRSDVLTNSGGAGAVSWDSFKALEQTHGFTAACYEGLRVPLAGGGQGIQWPPSGSPATCSYPRGRGSIYRGSDLYVPVMLHIAGEASIEPVNNAGGVRGSVEVVMSQGGWSRDLGGRSFLGGANNQRGNFVVRGAGSLDGENLNAGSKYVDDCAAAGYSECFNGSYVRLPLVKVGEPVTLSFKIKWENEGASSPEPPVRVNWRGRAIRIFFPRFQATHEQRDCGFSSAPNSCGASVAPMHVSYRTTNLDQPFSHSQRSESQCGRVVPNGYRPSIPEALESIRGEVRSGALKLEPIAFWSHGAAADRCNPIVSRQNCLEVPREYMKGCEPQYEMPGDAEAYCTLPDYQPSRDVITNPRFAYGESDRVESRGGCSEEAFPECASEHLRNRGSVFLGAASNGCEAALPVNVESLHTGALFKNTCVDTLAGFVEQYREKHKIPAPIEVVVHEQEEAPVITREEPTNSCWEYHRINGPGTGSWLCAERASYAVANRCCTMYGEESCSLERVAGGGGSGSASGFNQIVEGARNRTFATVQAAYPPAKMDLTCEQTADGEPSEDDCIAIQAGPADNGVRARVQASMRVPLALFDWFGMDNHTIVRYEETRMLESAIAGEVG